MYEKTINRRRPRGTGSILKKGIHFYLRVRCNGEEKHILLTDGTNIPVTTRKAAEQVASILQNIAGSKSVMELESFVKVAKLRTVKRIRLDDVWDTFHTLRALDMAKSTLNVYRCRFNHFLKWLHSYMPTVEFTYEVTPEIVNAYWAGMRQQLTPCAINNRIATQRHIFKVIHPDQPNPFDHIQSLQYQRTNRNVVPSDKAKMLLLALDDVIAGRKHLDGMRKLQELRDYKTIFMLCLYTGLRISDVYNLKWDSVDFKRNCIWTVPMKTQRWDPERKGVTIPIHPELRAELEYQRRKQPKTCDRVIGVELSSKQMYSIKCRCNKVLQRLLCPDALGNKGRKPYSVHCLRHTFISNCINNGVPSEVVASIVGHSSVEMTHKYTHIYDESKVDAINSLDSIYQVNDDNIGTDDKLYDLLTKLKALPAGVVDLLLQAVAK